MISVQTQDFSLADEYQALRNTDVSPGAVVTFIGLVRDLNLGDQVSTLELEHYPGMTENCLEDICQQAKERWDIHETRVIHRVGKLDANDQIVFVGVSSAHRVDAFAAAQFIMDILKTEAPFWKKESTPENKRWLDARESDTIEARKHQK